MKRTIIKGKKKVLLRKTRWWFWMGKLVKCLHLGVEIYFICLTESLLITTVAFGKKNFYPEFSLSSMNCMSFKLCCRVTDVALHQVFKVRF